MDAFSFPDYAQVRLHEPLIACCSFSLQPCHSAQPYVGLLHHQIDETALYALVYYQRVDGCTCCLPLMYYKYTTTVCCLCEPIPRLRNDGTLYSSQPRFNLPKVESFKPSASLRTEVYVRPQKNRRANFGGSQDAVNSLRGSNWPRFCAQGKRNSRL